MSAKAGRVRLAKQPDSLFHTCIRFVAKNLQLYKDIEYLELLPALVKNAIFLNVVRVHKGFHDEELPRLLLNSTLTRVNLSTSTITDGLLALLSEKCPHLRSLTLTEGNYRFTRAGLDAMIKQLGKLQHLYAKHCPVIDDEFVRLLTTSCPHLDTLDLESCKNVGDESADGLRDMPLVRLNVAHTGITDKFLKAIANERCGKTLEDLNVGHCPITSDGLAALPWDTIKYIGFEGCSIEDLDIVGFGKHLKYIYWTISN
ncbi:F-box/LRR-repeat protein 20-like [Anopheles ziemanni]|uniref:F-box/LRR-repeat protein 20-like n=1 Tax=Anopheles coustani TaxID=139045 RepID=UPI0026595D1B|nr:F-box/LRR-repeat protein 20-like [Anopheles coustani]XP_058170708.1 F-box/LRR-repeat protein 20-like [Anopheles ziemanni]